MAEQKFHERKFHELDISIELIIFSKFYQKRHGWAEIFQIVTYFPLFPSMTFFSLVVFIRFTI